MNCASCGCRMVPNRQVPPPGHRGHGARGLCRPCYSRAYKAGRLEEWPLRSRAMVRCRKPDCGFCDDMRWLADTGTGPHEWAERLGTNFNALSKRLYRHGLYDLANRVERIRNAQRRLQKEAA